MIGGMKAPQGGDSTVLSASNNFDNDQARSMLLVGPLSAGFKVEVSDSRTDWCADDYSALILTKDLPSGTDTCVDSFERSRTTTYWTQSFWEMSAYDKLDGKVSRVRMDDTGNPSSELNRCIGTAKYVLYEGCK